MYDSKNYLSVYKRDHKKWFRFIWKLKVLFFFYIKKKKLEKKFDNFI